jgi:hypothetical protein
VIFVPSLEDPGRLPGVSYFSTETGIRFCDRAEHLGFELALAHLMQSREAARRNRGT